MPQPSIPNWGPRADWEPACPQVVGNAARLGNNRWELIEWFMLVQWLCSIIILLPGAQAIRLPMRILPYAGNIVLFFAYLDHIPEWTRFPGTIWLTLVFTLMSAELLHPDTALIPGLGQVLFCASIALPAFWGGKAVRDKRRLDRILYLTFIFNAASAVVGFVQAKYGLLMPAEFSSVMLKMDPNKVEELTYVGAGGQVITRPAGLSDLPGGAGGAAAYTVVLGTALAVGLRHFGFRSLVYLSIVTIAMITLYLTQVRIMFLAAVLGLVLITWAVALHSVAYGARIILAGIGLLSGAFVYAVSIGGTSVSDRFATLVSGSPGQMYQENRGGFVQQTVDELLPKYPFGAGLGRWGMVRTYASPYVDDSDAPPIYVEIQMTGWLLDGGVMMWLFYGAALLSSLVYTYRTATEHADREVRYLAAVVFALNTLLLMMMFDFPVFNNQLGSQFWLLSSGLAGVCEISAMGSPDDVPVAHFGTAQAPSLT